MKMPCELIVWYVLPSIRRDLATKLKKKGMAQKDIAEKLGITPAAVSQYLKSRRGLSKFNNKEMETQIGHLADEIAAGRIKDLQPGICGICGVCKKTPVLESIYEKYGDK
ncbi:MAG: helix-turn-helix domain-containing protein [Candidatus Thermoplasmatota archaeon]|nr:helix-turn-helix domain-containing protein [Candidatus Thermoplasmatota archaeon]